MSGKVYTSIHISIYINICKNIYIYLHIFIYIFFNSGGSRLPLKGCTLAIQDEGVHPHNMRVFGRLGALKTSSWWP